jgi:membrane protein
MAREVPLEAERTRAARLLELWDAFGRALEELNQRNIGLIAAGVAFWGMLAIFPAMAAILALWGFFADPLVFDELLALGAEFLPPEAFNLIDRQVQRLSSANNSTLGWTTAFSTLLALWWSRAGTEALIRGLNAVYRRSNRVGMRQWLAPIGLTLAIVGVALVALASVVVVPIVLAVLPPGTGTQSLLSGSRWAIAAVVMVMGLGIVYRYGPNRDGFRRGPWLTPGVFVALWIWIVASWGFSAYIQNFARYNEIYGTLGAAVILLLWLYISAYAVLLGGALNAKLERNARRRKEQREHREPAPEPPPPAFPEDM